LYNKIGSPETSEQKNLRLVQRRARRCQLYKNFGERGETSAKDIRLITADSRAGGYFQKLPYNTKTKRIVSLSCLIQSG